MKKIYLSLIAAFGLTISSWGQNPGLVISEFLQNPSGFDAPYEYVELLATDNIDFSVTPYTIVVSNNGTASTSGWIAGGALTYAFEVTTGSVVVGDVLYVGGTSMAPTGRIIRAIDTGVDNGDGGIGNANSAGVFGNGGANADGIAVFNLPVASITTSTVPTDAILYGSGVGEAAISDTEGYELPINDIYNGGKLSLLSTIIVDDSSIGATSGVFDPLTNTFTTARIFEATTLTNDASSISIADVNIPKCSFVSKDITVNEGVGTITIELVLTEPNGMEASVDVLVNALSSATATDDFILVDTTIVFEGTVEDTLVFSLQIEEDALEEQSEYLVITLGNYVNLEEGELAQTFVYITDNDRSIPAPTNELKLQLLQSYSTGVEEESSAEIVVFDTVTNNLFVVNSIANQIDVIDFNIPATPVLIDSIAFDSVGFINSVAVFNGVIAVAVAAPVIQDSGFVSFWKTDGTFLNRLTVGALPDMVTFNNSGSQLVVACEGEPNADYTADPNGGIGIIEIDSPITELTAANVTVLDFTAFNSEINELKDAGVRIFGAGATVAQDIEPEYITILDSDELAYVVLQENNAFAKVDLTTKEILEIIPLGTIDHSVFGYGLDASNKTRGINIANFPIRGMFMPDAIAHINILGANYLLTANEGDSRDYDGYSEEVRVDDLVLDSLTFPNRELLQKDQFLGRLKTTTATGDTDNDGDIDIIHAYGTRSFSIWEETTGDLVFDSGDLIEQIIANDPVYSGLFNAHNEGGDLELKARSDDKGPEPEGIVSAIIDGNAYLFVSLERVGGAMVFNINDPVNPIYIDYHNNRNEVTNGPDRGAEGMLFIDQEISPNGNGLLILANEVSSTLSIYEVNSCLSLSDLEVTTATDAVTFCEGEELEVIATENESITYQWSVNGTEIVDEISNNYVATETGFYQVKFVNMDVSCEGTTDSLFITEIELPEIEIATATESLNFCAGDSLEIIIIGEEGVEYQWGVNGAEVTGAIETTYLALEEGSYYVDFIGEGACEGSTDSLVLSIVEIPEIDITTLEGETVFCAGESIEILIEEEAGVSYEWFVDATLILGENTASYNTSETGYYHVGFTTDIAGCIGMTDSIYLESIPLPMPTISVTGSVLSTAVFDTYLWSFEGEAITEAVAMEYTPTEDGTYSVLVTNEEGCEGEAIYEVAFTDVVAFEKETFSVYPNPTTGRLGITLPIVQDQLTQITVLDIAGQSVWVQNVKTPIAEMDLNHLHAGIYFVQVTLNGLTQSQKIIKK